MNRMKNEKTELLAPSILSILFILSGRQGRDLLLACC